MHVLLCSLSLEYFILSLRYALYAFLGEFYFQVRSETTIRDKVQRIEDGVIDKLRMELKRRVLVPPTSRRNIQNLPDLGSGETNGLPTSNLPNLGGQETTSTSEDPSSNGNGLTLPDLSGVLPGSNSDQENSVAAPDLSGILPGSNSDEENSVAAPDLSGLLPGSNDEGSSDTEENSETDRGEFTDVQVVPHFIDNSSKLFIVGWLIRF